MVSAQIIDIEYPVFTCVNDEFTVTVVSGPETPAENLEIDGLFYYPTSSQNNTTTFSILMPESPSGDYDNDLAEFYINLMASNGTTGDKYQVRVIDDPNSFPMVDYTLKSFCYGGGSISIFDLNEEIFLHHPRPLNSNVDILLEFSVDGEVFNPIYNLNGNNLNYIQFDNVYSPGIHSLCIRMINPYNESCFENICIPFEIEDPTDDPTFAVTGFSEGMDICLGQEVSFNNNFTYGQVAGDYIWTVSLPNDNNTIIYTQPHLDYTFNNSGTYEIGLGYINESGCTSPVYTETITVGNLEALEIECPSIVCAGARVEYCIPIDETCENLEWEVSEEGMVVGSNNRCITVEWSDQIDEYKVGYVNLLSANTCSTSYCFPSSVSVPIFPTMSDIVGPELICEDGLYTYMLPVITNASYTWSSIPDFSIDNSDDPNEYSITVPDTYIGDIEINASVTNNILGCDFETSFTAKVINLNGSMQICEGDDLIFSFEGSSDKDVIYDLTNSIGTIINSQTLDPSLTYVFSGLDVGNYTLDVTVEGVHCAQVIDVEVVDVIASDISGETNVCTNQLYSYSVTCNEGEMATWTVAQGCTETEYTGSTISVSWDSNITVCNPADQTPYKITVIKTRTLSDGSICESEPTEIYIYENLIDPVIEGPSTICYDAFESYSVDPIPGATYSWSVLPSANDINMGSIISGAGTSTIDVQWHLNTSITNAVLQLEVDFCDQITTVDYTVTFENLVVEMSGPNFLCAGEEDIFTLFSNNIPFGDIYESVEWYVNDELQDDVDHILNISFEDNGTYTIVAIIVNPNQCIAEPHVISKTVNIYGAIPILSDITGVCPVEDFISDEICIVNIDQNTTYEWTIAGNPIPVLNGDGAAGSCYTVTQSDIDTYGNPLTITIAATVNQGLENECSTIETYTRGWGCIAPCEVCEDPGLEIFYATFSGGSCDEIDFEGDIDNYYDVLNNLGTPSWRITALDPSPDQIVTTIEIGQFFDLTQEGISLAGYGPGTYRLSLISLAEGDYGDETPTGGGDDDSSIKGDSNTGSRMDCEDICNPLEYMEITIPYIMDYEYEFECLNNGQYQLILFDASEYAINYDQDGLTKRWIVNGSIIGTGDQATVIVNQGEAIQMSYTFTDPSITNYTCNDVSESFVAPTIDASFDTENGFTCVGNLLTFDPLVYTDSEIYFVTWDFGDGSGSHLINPTKEYENDGKNLVTLEIEDIYGCITTSSKEINIIPQNEHLGHIEYTMGTCDAEAQLSYVSETPGEVEIIEYAWSNPNLPLTKDVTVMSSGNYDVTITDLNGCTYSPGSVNVELDEAFGTGVTVSGDDCGNKTISFETADSYDYLVVIDGVCEPWTGDLLFYMPNNYEVSIYAFNPNKEIADCDNLQNACVFHTVDFVILSSPALETIIVETVECEYNTLSLSNSENYTSIVWSGSNISPTASSTISITNGGSYFCTYTNPENGCERTVSTFVSGTPTIDFTAFIDGCFDYCLDDMTLITGYLTGIPGSYGYWEWRFDGNAIPNANGDAEISNLNLGELSFTTDVEHKIELYIEIYNNAGEVICSDTSDPFCITVEDCTDCEELEIQGDVTCASEQSAGFSYSYTNTHSLPSDAALCNGELSILNPKAVIGNLEYAIENGVLSIDFDFNISDEDFADETNFEFVLCDENGMEAYCYILTVPSIVCMQCEEYEIELPYPGCVHIYELNCVTGESNGGPIYNYEGPSVLPDDWDVNTNGYTVSSDNGTVTISSLEVITYSNAPANLATQTLNLTLHYTPIDPSIATTIEFQFYDEFGNLEYCYQIYFPAMECQDDQYECNMWVDNIYNIFDPCAGVDEVKIEVCADLFTNGSDKCDITEFVFDVDMYDPNAYNTTFADLDDFTLSSSNNDFSEKVCFELTVSSSTFVENEGWCIEIIATSNCDGIVCSEVLCDVFYNPSLIVGSTCIPGSANNSGKDDYQDYIMSLAIPNGFEYSNLNVLVDEGTVTNIAVVNGIVDVTWRTTQSRERPIFSGKLILRTPPPGICPHYKFPFTKELNRCNDSQLRFPIADDKIKDINMQVYPLPSNGYINISLDLDSEQLSNDLHLYLTDYLGRKVSDSRINCESQNCKLKMNIDESGIYFLRLMDDNIQLAIEKVLIVK